MARAMETAEVHGFERDTWKVSQAKDLSTVASDTPSPSQTQEQDFPFGGLGKPFLVGTPTAGNRK